MRATTRTATAARATTRARTRATRPVRRTARARPGRARGRRNRARWVETMTRRRRRRRRTMSRTTSSDAVIRTNCAYGAYYVAATKYENRERGLATLVEYMEGGNAEGAMYPPTNRDDEIFRGWEDDGTGFARTTRGESIAEPNAGGDVRVVATGELLAAPEGNATPRRPSFIARGSSMRSRRVDCRARTSENFESTRSVRCTVWRNVEMSSWCAYRPDDGSSARASATMASCVCVVRYIHNNAVMMVACGFSWLWLCARCARFNGGTIV